MSCGPVLVNVFMDEVGAGDPEFNHANVYTALRSAFPEVKLERVRPRTAKGAGRWRRLMWTIGSMPT